MFQINIYPEHYTSSLVYVIQKLYKHIYLLLFCSCPLQILAKMYAHSMQFYATSLFYAHSKPNAIHAAAAAAGIFGPR
jgi:hypothetical protein